MNDPLTSFVRDCERFEAAFDMQPAPLSKSDAALALHDWAERAAIENVATLFDDPRFWPFWLALKHDRPLLMTFFERIADLRWVEQEWRRGTAADRAAPPDVILEPGRQPERIERLAERLQDPQDPDRVLALDVLCELASSGDEAAARALAQIAASGSAADPFLARVRDAHPGGREAAGQALTSAPPSD